jgi:2-polyprenyl-3-methyl-5-hydroxy-6-metoxy-1,4-benzoquinol methylase
MTSSSKAPVGDRYVLPTGKDDASRLDVIHAVYGPVSLRALTAAGIDTATRAADIGCGTGTVTRWMAEQMGAAGRVDGIDIAPEQIEVARATAPGAGAAAITYQQGSAYEPGLSERAYDVVFCRLVLCHLQEPAKAVAKIFAVVGTKP